MSGSGGSSVKVHATCRIATLSTPPVKSTKPLVWYKARSMDAEILTIGDELNRGEIVDTNSSWLSERLTALGAHVRWRSSVTDDPQDLTALLETAAARAQLVVASGGLGPTDDDRTVDVVARLLGAPPAVDSAHEARMRERFSRRNFAHPYAEGEGDESAPKGAPNRGAAALTPN